MLTAKSEIDYLLGLLPWTGSGVFTKNGIRQVMKALGDPQDKIKTVHIGGTNGKGSVSAFISSILGASGYRVGLNTSPHLSRVNERIVVDGCSVSNDFIAEYTKVIRAVSAKLKLELSYFEFVTAIAFLGFFEIGVDWGVFEVGLGGRLDATNIIKRPEASLIVSVDKDHEDILGYSIPEIAREKGGIIKDSGLVITGPLKGGAFQSIAEISRDRRARHVAYGRDFGVKPCDVPTDTSEFVFLKTGRAATVFKSALIGAHQKRNASLAVMFGLEASLNETAISHGVENVFWPGRFEILSWNNRRLIIDCAHNPAGILELVNCLRLTGISSVDIAFGALNTKNWREMVDILAPISGNWYLLEPESEMAVSAIAVQGYLSSIGISGRVFGRDHSAFFESLDSTDAINPLLLVGSIYLIGRLREFVIQDEKPLWERLNS